MSNLINKKTTSIVIEILAVCIIFFVGYLLFLNNSYGLNTFNGGDVHRGFHRGLNLLNGVNSYMEFNPDRMLIQEKVPGFFPLYFYLMALIALVSKCSAVIFFDTLRYLVFFSYLGIGLSIYLRLRKKGVLLGILGMSLFMFNKWTVDDVLGLKQDSYVILITLLSLFSLKKNRLLAYLLLGVATGIKHLTVFVLPIYMLDLLKPFIHVKKVGLAIEVKKALVCTFLVALPVLGPAVPYIIKTPKHFVSAIMYNTTRESEGNESLRAGFDKLLVLYNQDRNNTAFYFMLPRLPMLLVFVFLVVSFLSGKIDVWKYSALAYLVFVAFNPVLFGQYYVWFMAFVPFALIEFD